MRDYSDFDLKLTKNIREQLWSDGGVSLKYSEAKCLIDINSVERQLQVLLLRDSSLWLNTDFVVVLNQNRFYYKKFLREQNSNDLSALINSAEREGERDTSLFCSVGIYAFKGVEYQIQYSLISDRKKWL